MLNEMSRSMGQPDFYPFVLPRDVVAKLHFIHLVVTSGSWQPDATGQVAPAPFSAPDQEPELQPDQPPDQQQNRPQAQ